MSESVVPWLNAMSIGDPRVEAYLWLTRGLDVPSLVVVGSKIAVEATAIGCFWMMLPLN